MIGVDFDNTVVCYDDVMYREARSRRLIDPSTVSSKRAIRDQIRRLPDGEREWQQLQAIVYGPEIHEASLTDGVEAFFRTCREHDIRVVIISHKTTYASVDETQTNLRIAALAWMRRHRVFDRSGFGLSSADVYFASSRQEKIAWISRLGCTAFIDDLEETFAEPDFPSDVDKILYAPHGPISTLPAVKTMTSWQEIRDALFAPVQS
ncbi:MAG: hypothetical protein HYW10_04900 [Candidatus Omnitrophica bacterium]|nr:hypothetical protein [Candidatus Omnitrophota bacterium]